MILDTLYFLVKSQNAKEAAKDLGDVSKAADDLKKKLNKASKANQQVEDDLEDTTDAAKKSRNALVDLASTAGAAFAAYEVAKKIVQATKATVDYNVEVSNQAKLMNLNANEVSALSSALGRMTGTDGKQALSWLSQMNLRLAEMGMSDRTKNIPAFLEEWADKLKGMDISDALTVGTRVGFTPEMILALRQGGDALRQMVEYEKQLAPLTDQTAASSLRFKQELEDLGKVGMGFINTFLPLLEGVLKVIGFIGQVGDIVIGKPLQWIFSLGGGPSKNAPLTGPAAQLGGVLGTRTPGSGGNTSNAAMQQSYKFWLAQGYTPQQAAGLVANEQRESQFNAGATGDNGAAKGIFQWHDDRRQKIFQGTGIDIASASHDDQLRAAAWELQQRGDDTRLRATSTPEDAARIISLSYERPADAQGEAALRAQYAHDDYMRLMMDSAGSSIKVADSTPLVRGAAPATGGSNVTIGSITIQTQATDSDGIAREIHQKINDVFNNAVANADDGISH